MQQYTVTGMHCAACSASVEKAVKKVPGVTSCAVSLLTNSMGVEGTAEPAAIINAVEDAGYGASVRGQEAAPAADASALEDRQTPHLKKRLIASVAFLLILMYFSMGHMMWGWPLPGWFDGNHVAMGLVQLLLAGIVMVINQEFFVSGTKSLLRGSPNMDTLVSLGAAASYGWSVYALFAMTDAQLHGGSEAAMAYMDEFYFESAAMILTLITVGKLLEAHSKGRTTDALKSLMALAPETATVIRDGKEVKIPAAQVRKGDVFVVRPGQSIPVDGIVLDGASAVNEAALTGESLPRDVKVGDEIISGCIDLSGVLKIRTTKAFGESTVSKILDLVENASSRKSRSETFISRFAKVYTPAVCAAALALAVLVPLGRMLAGADANWTDWVYRALSFLVVSCPCALVISIPLSFFAGIGGASREGVLIKGSNYLEALSAAKVVVFDKTGTLTRGVFEVTAVHHSPLAEEQLLEYAALAECASSHPISKSLQKAYGKEIDRSRVTDIEELSGHGITATVDGHAVAAGNSKLMKKLGVPYCDCHSTGTIIHMAVDGQYAGHIVISDVVKPHSKEAIEQLKRAGVQKTVMLTGDAKRVADNVAAELGVDEVRSELLPGDKVAEVEKLLAAKGKNDMLAFVGDGINDAPVLTRADIGIAMGAMGSDAAIEAADIVLMDDDPLQIAKAIKISRKCIGIVRQNIVFSLVVKFGCLALVAFGVANMWAAIFADVGVMVLAVLNAIRALKYKD